MTQEQYNRAVGLNKKISCLSNLKQDIERNGLKLSYVDTSCNTNILDFRCSVYGLYTIPEILDRHDKMIREEIDAEIKKLKKEIEEL